MNSLQKNIFSVLYPLYPLLAWGFHFASEKSIGLFLNVALLPIAMLHLFTSRKRLPAYLVCFILFTIYHLCTSFINNTIPVGTNKIFFILADMNVFACTLFIIIENTEFDKRFISRMNRNIFIIIIISLIVSVIQIKDPQFFFNTAIPVELYIGTDEIRNASIYSWVSINSGGITVPILIALLLNFYEIRSKAFPVILISGIVIAFLSKARYVMVSTIIAFSQLFFSGRVRAGKIVSLVFLFAVCIYAMIMIAAEYGYDINEVISTRILEKGNDMESAKARVTSYEVFMKKFPEHPLLGVGPETRDDVVALLGGEAPMIHVGYLSYLYFYGFAGCFFLFYSLFLLLRKAWLIGSRFRFWGSFYGLLTFCFANITFVYFNFSEMGVVLTVIYIKYYGTDYIEEEEPEDEFSGAFS